LSKPLNCKWFKPRWYGIGESNWDHTYKVKDIGLGPPGAPYLPSKGQKASKIGKIGKMSLKMGNIRLYFVITSKI
jgi:hypothetical protein